MTLDELWTGSGAAAWGTCAYRDLLPAMDEAAQAKAAGLCPDPAGVFVAAYPYFPGDAPGNLSLYARGQDYHVAIPRRMERVCQALREGYPAGPLCGWWTAPPCRSGCAPGWRGWASGAATA